MRYIEEYQNSGGRGCNVPSHHLLDAIAMFHPTGILSHVPSAPLWMEMEEFCAYPSMLASCLHPSEPCDEASALLITLVIV